MNRQKIDKENANNYGKSQSVRGLRWEIVTGRWKAFHSGLI